MNILIAAVILTSSFLSPFVPNPTPPPNTVDCQPHAVNGYSLPGWVTNNTWYREMPQYTTGKAVWYAPHLMETTAQFRGMSLDGFMGGVATNSVGMMGKVIWLKRPGLSWEGPYLVVDVGQRNHAYHQAINVGTIVEVDFETAARWGIVTKTTGGKGYRVNYWAVKDVQMWVGLEPPNMAAGSAMPDPINYHDWYLQNAQICDGEPNRKWKLTEDMIADYEDYEELLKSKGGEATLQLQSIELNEETIRQAIIIRSYLAGLTTRYVSYFVSPPPPAAASSQIEPQEQEKILTIHTLKSHETWTHLALYYYGHTTEPYWRLIYEANIDTVGDDYHHIWGGMQIVIPQLPPNFSP